MLQTLCVRLGLMMADPAGALKREDGQTLVEYALIIALVSVALIASLKSLRTSIAGVFTAIGTALASA
jgi:pilus assembly protein Flp/PilA